MRILSVRWVVAAIAVVAVASLLTVPSAMSATKITVSVGRQPWAAGNSPITQYMIDHKLFEKYAAQFGFDVTVDYRDYPSALPMVEAMVGGKLDFGMWGNTPIVRAIAQQVPLSVLDVGEGHFRFIIATRAGSGIRNLHDLKGKTVGVLLGGDPYNAFSQMLYWVLGNGDPRALNIRLVNTPTQAQAATVPKGMDATVVTYPAYLEAQLTDPNVKGIANSFGYTEDYYKGRLGEGAGHLYPEVKKSPFYPDGFYLHRSFWVVRNAIMDKYPNLVVAFIMAQQAAVEALDKMQPGPVAALVQKYWQLPPDVGAKVVKDEVLFIRNWVWPTQGDAWALVKTSQFMVAGKMIDKPLTWKEVTDDLAKAAPLLQTAYTRMGSYPPAAAFTDKNARDLRGLPVWDVSKWKLPTQ